jgi:NAD(P)-dependent dehydrogenase (short-subunit alcohol dehydrogenase family)
MEPRITGRAPYRPITEIARESVHEGQDGRHNGWHIRHRRGRSRKARPNGYSDRSGGERQIAWRGDFSAASNARAPNLGHRVHYADLTRISEMKRVATEIAETEPRIDVLINNAGAMFATRKLTEDGLEYTFAFNHMA